MRQRKTLCLSVRGRLIVLATASLFAATFISYQQFSSVQVVEAQARRQSRKSRPKRNLQARPRLNAASFKHEHHRLPTAKLICSDCHTIAEKTAPDVIAAATKITIKGYPYHDSCLGCHRQKPPLFFRGATPTICTVCHTRSSPRLTARDMSPFPKQNEQARELEFPGYYPHDQSDHKRVNCGTCHLADQRAYTAIPVGAGEAAHRPSPGTFKTSPSGHAACFKCHWEEKPLKDDCAGCHLTPPEVASKRRNLPSADPAAWFKTWPLEWPKRISLKFNHDSKEHYETDCTDCHTNAREMNTLDSPKAEVKIAACVTCHFKSAPNIGKEMFDEDTEDTAEGRNNISTSKAGKHTCTGCHTNVIGGTPPPCSHFLVGDKYLSLEDYSENAGRIAERCKKNGQ